MTTGIAGAGRVAQALGRRLQELGHPIHRIASRSLEHAEKAAEFIGGDCQPVAFHALYCERMLIAVPDRAIVAVAEQLSGCKILLHTCGAHGSELLRDQRAAGVICGSLHPFQTFPTPDAGYRVLPGSAFAVDGDPLALAWAEDIVGRFQGLILRIPSESRAIYHAAAAMASNHLTAVVDAASGLLRLAGFSEGTVFRAIEPISRSALTNTFEQGPVLALTGPVERGDIQTVSRHLQALEIASESIQQLYRAASLQALDIAVRRGIDSETAGEMRSILTPQ